MKNATLVQCVDLLNTIIKSECGGGPIQKLLRARFVGTAEFTAAGDPNDSSVCLFLVCSGTDKCSFSSTRKFETSEFDGLGEHAILDLVFARMQDAVMQMWCLMLKSVPDSTWKPKRKKPYTDEFEIDASPSTEP